MSSNTDANETDVLAISQRQFEYLTAQLEAANKRVEIYERALGHLVQVEEWQHLSKPEVTIGEVSDIAAKALANEGGK